MSYLLAHRETVGHLLLQHLFMAFAGVGISLLVALPVGVIIASHRWLITPVMGILGVCYTIPSLALMIFLIPVLGLNSSLVIVATAIYGQVVLVRNVLAGLDAIDHSIIEAAKGMGMNPWQCWWYVRFPLALPIILAGLRVAAIIAIGIASIGAKFGAGGLGKLLFDGITQSNDDKIWAGAIAIVGLAMTVSFALQTLQHLLHPEWAIRRASRRAS